MLTRVLWYLSPQLPPCFNLFLFFFNCFIALILVSSSMVIWRNAAGLRFGYEELPTFRDPRRQDWLTFVPTPEPKLICLSLFFRRREVWTWRRTAVAGAWWWWRWGIHVWLIGGTFCDKRVWSTRVHASSLSGDEDIVWSLRVRVFFFLLSSFVPFSFTQNPVFRYNRDFVANSGKGPYIFIPLILKDGILCKIWV
jgi:hypothetical protein